MFKNCPNGSYEPKRLLFSWNIPFSAYIQSLIISEADSLKNGGTVTFLNSRLITNVLEQCLKRWNQLLMRSWIWSRIFMRSLFEALVHIISSNHSARRKHLRTKLCWLVNMRCSKMSGEHCTENPIYEFLKMKLRSRSQFLHSCICDRSWEYINRSQITLMWKSGDRTL